jgi:hypothetical protein
LVADYRIYRLNRLDRIVSADWIEADTDHQALSVARSLCGAGAESVEVWQLQSRIGLVSCDDEG